jgi:xylulokinase
VVRAGDVIITLSTNGLLRLTMTGPLSPEVRVGHALFNWPYVENLWIAGGQTKAGGSSLRWWVNLVTGADDAPAYDRLLAAADESPPGSGGVIFLPYLIGRGSPRGDASAAGNFSGLTLATGQGAMTRAVMEGVAFALRDIFDDFKSMGHAVGAAHLSGGGARSVLWREIVANVLGCPIKVYAADSTLGAAMVAAIGSGLYADFAAAAEAMTRSLETVEPSPRLVETYDGCYQTFQTRRDTLYPSSPSEASL